MTIPQKVKKTDIFISFNDLGYVKDISTFVHNVKSVLNKKGKFCFYIQHHFLNVAPNALVVDDKKKIIQLFKKEKLEASYTKKRRLFKTEIFIYGQKKS